MTASVMKNATTMPTMRASAAYMSRLRSSTRCWPSDMRLSRRGSPGPATRGDPAVATRGSGLGIRHPARVGGGRDDRCFACGGCDCVRLSLDRVLVLHGLHLALEDAS